MGFTSKRPSLAQSMAQANSRMPLLFLAIITMTAIAVFVQYQRMQPSRDIRAKAFQQGTTGIRVEAEEMTLTGVSKDPTNTFIQF